MKTISRFLFRIVVCSSILGGTFGDVVAATEDLSRSFTLSTGYLEKIFNSNEGLSYFPLSAIQLYSKAFDSITNGLAKGVGGRVGVILLELPVSYWLTNSLFVPYHEFGHARAMYSWGWSSYNYLTQGWIYGTVYSYWGLSFWRLLTPPFGFPGSGNASAHSIGDIENALSAGLSQYYGTNSLAIIISGGGLNNQMLLAKKVADLVYEKNGHITYFQHYIGNKISGYVYTQMDQANVVGPYSDIKSLVNKYADKGYHISRSDIQQQSLISLLSGTTAAFLIGYSNYINSGEAVIEPLEIAGFRIPDINSYYNARGLSYEFVTGYRVNAALRFDLSYETIWKGNTTQQITPKVHYQLATLFPKLNDCWVAADVVIGQGIGGSLEAQWAPNRNDSDNFFSKLSYFARLIHYNGYTLYGERNIPSLMGQEVSTEAILGLNYRY